MRQASNDHDARHIVDVPRHKADQRLRPQGQKAHRTGGHHIAKAEHHRRYENGDQDQRFNQAAAGQVGANHQKRQHATQRNGDDDQPEGENKTAFQRLIEIRVGEDKTK